MVEKSNEFQQAWSKIVAKAWSDADFKKRLLANPNEVFQSYGIKIPPGTKVMINENTSKDFYLTLPKKPADEFVEETLKQISAAGILQGPCVQGPAGQSPACV